MAQSLNKKELVRQKLREEIISGRLNPGDAIAERTVAEEFEVSRVPVREALIQLERDGLVEISPGRGAQVRRFNAGNIESLYHVREALEGMAARLAAARMRPMELATFRQKFQDISANPSRKDLLSISRLGDEFHSAVIHGSRNSMIIDISGSIADRVHLARRLSYGHVDAASVGKATQEHLGDHGGDLWGRSRPRGASDALAHFRVGPSRPRNDAGRRYQQRDEDRRCNL